MTRQSVAPSLVLPHPSSAIQSPATSTVDPTLVIGRIGPFAIVISAAVLPIGDQYVRTLAYVPSRQAGPSTPIHATTSSDIATVNTLSGPTTSSSVELVPLVAAFRMFLEIAGAQRVYKARAFRAALRLLAAPDDSTVVQTLSAADAITILPSSKVIPQKPELSKASKMECGMDGAGSSPACQTSRPSGIACPAKTLEPTFFGMRKGV